MYMILIFFCKLFHPKEDTNRLKVGGDCLCKWEEKRNSKYFLQYQVSGAESVICGYFLVSFQYVQYQSRLFVLIFHYS